MASDYFHVALRYPVCMDATPRKPARNSRWSREPVIGRSGAPRAVFPTERDLEIFQLLVRYRYLPSDTIHAFVGGNAKALLHRFNLLCRKPNLYLCRPQQQRQNAEANYRPLIYQLDERGSRALRERGLPFLPKSHHHNFAHELMVTQIIASFELGTRQNASARLIAWPEILAHARMPRATREAPNPAAVRVAYILRAEQRCDVINADARPFGLERIIGGQRSYMFFPGIEADCGSEPIDAADPGRSSIAKKFAAYLAIAEQGLYRAHFGFPNFFVPFITTTTARLETMMELLERMTAGRGSKILLFKTFPSFTSPERPPAATGHMLTAPWLRAGYSPLHLDR
jgi:protein involved in plasmid replication-relaxation